MKTSLSSLHHLPFYLRHLFAFEIVTKKNNVCLYQIIASNPGEEKTFGEDFGIEDELISHISRRSIDILKTLYRVSLTSLSCSPGFLSKIIVLKINCVLIIPQTETLKPPDCRMS